MLTVLLSRFGARPRGSAVFRYVHSQGAPYIHLRLRDSADSVVSPYILRINEGTKNSAHATTIWVRCCFRDAAGLNSSLLTVLSIPTGVAKSIDVPILAMHHQTRFTSSLQLPQPPLGTGVTFINISLPPSIHLARRDISLGLTLCASCTSSIRPCICACPPP